MKTILFKNFGEVVSFGKVFIYFGTIEDKKRPMGIYPQAARRAGIRARS